MKVNVTYNEESKYDVGDLVMVRYVRKDILYPMERKNKPEITNIQAFDRPALIMDISYSKDAHEFIYDIKLYVDKDCIEQATSAEADILYKFLHVVGEWMNK